MKLTYFLERCEAKLKSAIPDNMAKYMGDNAWVSEFFNGERFCAEAPIDVELPELIVAEHNVASTDAENTAKFYTAMKVLTVPQASDARLWSYLCHTHYYEYVQNRWDISASSKLSKETISSRFFKSTNVSRALIRNAISRLWWFGYLTYDSSQDNPFELTNILLEYQDIQASLLERSFGKNDRIRRNYLMALKNKKNLWKNRDVKAFLQELGKHINRLGSVSFLDVMDGESLVSRIEDCIETVCND